MEETSKMMDLTEFQRKGFLQEANRQFFHPLGLALALSRPGDDGERILGVWDHRDDPEGIVFTDLTDDVSAVKAGLVEVEFTRHAEARTNLLGQPVQAMGTTVDVDA